MIAVIFTAAMSSSSGELNSLAAVSVMDIYRGTSGRDATDRHYLMASRLFTAAGALWAVIFAQYAKNLGSLVEAVNQVGSFFYPVLLGVFMLAFFFRRVQGGAAFWAMLTGEARHCRLRAFHEHRVPLVQRDRRGGRGGLRACCFPFRPGAPGSKAPGRHRPGA